jgi:mannitol-1-phosphate 5-dehydrogenase
VTLTGKRRYVGFGFGAIQAGLFLYEAYQSDNFEQLTVAEVVPQVVDSIRQADGRFKLNIAYEDRIEQVEVGPIRIENPTVEADRQRLIKAIADADEIGTAVPSVAYYASEGAGSLHRILAEGLWLKAATGKPRAIVYTAENNNRAAEILEAQVMGEIPEAEREAVRKKVCFLNTVIGKMSGMVTEAAEIQAQQLATVTPDNHRAYLVEQFNHILISQIKFPEAPFERGITVFEEKPDLLPFEEAKLYRHNAVHALAAYMGALLNLRRIADLQTIPGAMAFIEGAMIDESNAALSHKYAGIDPLFMPDNYQEDGRALLKRIMNPYLRDTIDRIGRDPKRKLGWDDRLIGTMRLILGEGIQPYRYAFGTAAALVAIDPSIIQSAAKADSLLLPIWKGTPIETTEQNQILEFAELGLNALRRWVAEGYPNLDEFYRSMKR